MVDWPKVMIDSKDIDMCFGCGRNNPIGLKLEFTWDGKIVRGEFTPDAVHQGWSGVVHGGIIECLLDEVMSYTAYFEGIRTVTAKMNVRMVQVARIGDPLIATASITKRNRKLIKTKGALSLQDGSKVAEGTATLFIFENNMRD